MCEWKRTTILVDTCNKINCSIKKSEKNIFLYAIFPQNTIKLSKPMVL